MVAEFLFAVVLAVTATFTLVALAGWNAPTYYRGIPPAVTLFRGYR